LKTLFQSSLKTEELHIRGNNAIVEKKDLLCNGTKAMMRAPPIKVEAPILSQVKYMTIINCKGPHHK
jgi:hypothetical protein